MWTLNNQIRGGNLHWLPGIDWVPALHRLSWPCLFTGNFLCYWEMTTRTNFLTQTVIVNIMYLPFHRCNSLVKWKLISLLTVTHFFRQNSVSCTFLHFLDRFENSLSSPIWQLNLRRQIRREVRKRERQSQGQGRGFAKITEPYCQGFVSVFVIQWLKRSLCVWLRSNGMLTQPWSCLSNIINLDKRSERVSPWKLLFPI